MSVRVSAFCSFGYILRRRTSGNSAFNFLQHCHIVFHCGCTILPSQQGPNFSPFLPTLALCVLFVYLFYYYSHPSGCELALHCGLDLRFHRSFLQQAFTVSSQGSSPGLRKSSRAAWALLSETSEYGGEKDMQK